MKSTNTNNPYNRRCINGKITGCGNCVGYCNFHGHPGYLTKDLRKEHNCIKKGCYYYEPKERQLTSISVNPFGVLLSFVPAN